MKPHILVENGTRLKYRIEIVATLEISKFKCVENLQEFPEVSDVDMTQLNNRRRCFVLQKREFDRIDDKKLGPETDDA